MGQESSLPVPVPLPRQIEKTSISAHEIPGFPYTHRGPSHYLVDLPTIIPESCIGDGRMAFSIRGDDEALYQAYFQAFLRTWGPYVMFREEPDRMADGKWVVIGWTSPTVWEAWYGPSEFTKEAKEVYDKNPSVLRLLK